MGKKYSINSAGRIVAERDIYSLGGLIVKGSIGGSVKDETQLSQSGECWLNAGDISNRPDIVIKDNAYIGTFTPGVNPVHTDGVTEFSGNTLIPGNISVRSFVADTKNNVFVKDSFIGVSMDVLCGPSTTASAFPFEQGDFKKEVAKGTLFTSASMRLDDVSACRNTATLRLGRNTYLYIPTGYRARVFWAYYDTSNQIAYSGESTAVLAGLTKLNHSVYKLAMVSVVKNDGTAMTPANLLATGAKILGHISGSLLQDFRPESVSGEYVMVNSSLIAETDNFGLATTQLRFLAGGMYNTNMYTLTNRQDYKPYGTFRNVERLEYIQYFADIHRGNANRDNYIVASDSPLVRINDGFVPDSIVNAGGVTLRRCIVPKAEFQNDIINGNVYEDIDFSYANEDLGFTMTGYTRFISSHKQGIYRMSGGPSSTGFASHKGNLDPTARLYQAEVYLPLDGSIMEQGAYGGGSQIPYESAKTDSPIRVRTGKPIATFGLVFPSLPAGYSVKALYYLDEDFIIRSTITDPTELVNTYPYVVMLFRKEDDSAITVSDFIALNRTLRIIDHSKAPEITGSAYMGAGVTVHGDVKLIGDPYVNRVFDVNMWERGTTLDGAQPNYPTWEDRKVPTGAGNRFRFINQIPVEPGVKITCNPGYWVLCYFFDGNGNYLSSPGWGQIGSTAPANSAFVGVVIKKAVNASDAGGLIDDSDIPLANVKYLRAFEKRRYITNELDRTSPKDILLGPDFFEQGGISIAEWNAGKPYEELKIGSPYRIRLKRLFGLGAGYRVTFSSVYSFGTNYHDAVTKLLYGSTSANMNNALLSLVGGIADSPTAAITPADVTAARLVIEFTPSPRIIVPYGSDTLFISGPKIRMYDNAVLSRNFNQEGSITLQGDAVMGYDFDSGACLCSNGHDDAIIKLP
jgi:hypothetical protein|nr:MAG TPA: Putative transferase, nesg, ydcK, Structural Genomics.38A [Caudoviricetes sp.]